MVELPEANVLATQVNETIAGKRIWKVIANQSPHKFAWFTGDPATYQALLTGKPVHAASAHGNHIEIQTGDMLLVINTPMKYHAAGEKPPKKHQLLVEFDDGSTLSCTVQMWGGLFCFPEGEEGGLADYQMAKRKPSPLTEAFNWNYFESLIDKYILDLSAKAFLATEQRIPGLGNGVLQDILWNAKVHPKRKLADLSLGDLQRLYEAVTSVLREMTAQGGRDTERDLFSQAGGYKTILSKNTVAKPCPACGTIIGKEAYLGGSIYFCESCQSL